MNLAVIILTKDEELHIERALASVEGIAERCFVVDSGSTDRTLALARSKGATVLRNPWLNYATQFNWALAQLPEGTDWVLRLDADEIVTASLRQEIMTRLRSISADVDGIYISRSMKFLGGEIRFGGLFPIRVIRLFRHGRGRCEDRWMDEHIIVHGPTAEFSGEIVDDNLNSLTWWTQKHNFYASREVVDLLNLEFGFMPRETVAAVRGGQQAGIKRWIKEVVYAKLPGGLRVFLYFFYRFFVRLGFLDGREGRSFHILQGFWYRYLVDAKLAAVKGRLRVNGADVVSAIHDVLGIDVRR